MFRKLKSAVVFLKILMKLQILFNILNCIVIIKIDFLGRPLSSSPAGEILINYVMVCYGMVWYGMVWYGMVWYGMVWYGMVWYGMVWYGVVWFDLVLRGLVWYGMLWNEGLNGVNR